MKRQFFSGFILPVLLLAEPGHAVVSFGGPNSSAPAGLSAYGNVGRVNGSSAVYLGNGWVISTYHGVQSLPGSVHFGGANHVTQSGSWVRLSDIAGVTTPTDLVLFRLASDPGLPSLAISTSPPTVGDEVILAGGGRVQENDPTHWEVTVVPGPDNDVWSETTPGSADKTGYKTTAAKEVAWGTNQVAATGEERDVGYGPIWGFTTTFDPIAGEGQAVNGDSGGAVFIQSGSSWELAGLMNFVTTLENQPRIGGVSASTAVEGQTTFSIDLTLYRPQILAVISSAVPEPSAVLLVAVSSLAGVIRRRR